MRRALPRLALALASLALAATALAEPYPAKPIRLLISSAPGGGTDSIGRVVGDALSTLLKVPVVPDNRAGAGGQIASEQLLKTPPDGYTIMITQNAHVTNPAFLKKLPYDTVKDFTPIAPLATSPLVLVSSGASGVKSWAELVALSKRDPRSLSFAIAESSARMAVEQISDATGVKMVSLPYKGTGPAVTDVAGGHVNYTVTTMASVLPFKGTGKINFLAVLGGERSPFLPDVPTLAEQGVPGVEVKGWWAIFGPSNMPPAVVEQLNDAIRTALAQPQVKAKIHTFCADPWIGTPQELDQFVRREIPSILRLARKAGIEPE
jgi:tripartite-type tricarboxylate transporter receptor subunit TctC